MSVRQRGNTKLGLDSEAMQTVAILCGVGDAEGFTSGWSGKQDGSA